MPLIQNQRLAFSFGKESAFGVAQAVAKMWSFSKLNGDLLKRNLATEDDAAEFGKSDEFAHAEYKTAWTVSGSLNKYLGSQMAAWLFSFGLGKVVVTGSSSPYTYTCTPLDTTVGLQLPSFTYVSQLPGTDHDTMAAGCVVNNFTITLNSGPGRQNSQFTMGFIGSGILTEPSAITIPAITSDNLLNAGALACTINGVDYVANENILNITLGWNNNLRSNEGYFPGSGYQSPGDGTSGQVMGRLEVGPRQLTMSFVVRKNSASTEYAKLKALTTGTAVINLTADSSNSLVITAQKVAFADIVESDTNGIASATITCSMQVHPTNGLISAVAVTPFQGICQ